MKDPLDVRQLSLRTDAAGRALQTPRRRPPRHRPGERFLKGPIPLKWLVRAARLPGRALHVGNAVWYLAGLTRSGTVKLSNSVLELFGVDRYAKARALEALEQAGLVSVQRQCGKHPTVTIEDVAEVVDEDP